jgi:hypothetical protein
MLGSTSSRLEKVRQICCPEGVRICVIVSDGTWPARSAGYGSRYASTGQSAVDSSASRLRAGHCKSRLSSCAVLVNARRKLMCQRCDHEGECDARIGIG